MSAAWERELTRLERDVHAACSLLEAGEVPPAERWSPPEGLGPLPESLRPRLEQLMQRLQQATLAAAARRDELGRELTELQHRREAARAYGLGGEGTPPPDDPTTSTTAGGGSVNARTGRTTT